MDYRAGTAGRLADAALAVGAGLAGAVFTGAGAGVVQTAEGLGLGAGLTVGFTVGPGLGTGGAVGRAVGVLLGAGQVSAKTRAVSRG